MPAGSNACWLPFVAPFGGRAPGHGRGVAQVRGQEVAYGNGVRVPPPMARAKRATTRTTTPRIAKNHPMSADIPATPLNPSKAATIAMTKNVKAQFSIGASFLTDGEQRVCHDDPSVGGGHGGSGL